MQHFRIAWASLAKNALSSGFVICLLTVGAVSVAVVWALINQVVLRPLPYAHPEQMVWLSESGLQDRAETGISLPAFKAWRDGASQVVEISAIFDGEAILNWNDSADLVTIGWVSPNFMSVTGLPPALGQPFPAEASFEGDENRAILSHTLWKSRFQGDPRVIGRTVRLNGASYLVQGVAAEHFTFPPATAHDLWVMMPRQVDPANNTSEAKLFHAVGRLKDPLARASLPALLTRIKNTALPEDAKVTSARVTSLTERVAGSWRMPLLTLLGAMAMIQLLACGNSACMLLARAVGEQQRVAIMRSLGASTLAILVTKCTEALMLSGAAGFLAWLLTPSALKLVLRHSPDILPVAFVPELDARTLLVCAAVSTAAAVLVMILPALFVSKVSPIMSLAAAGTARGSIGSRAVARNYKIVIGGQLALTVVLSVAGGLLMRTFTMLQSATLGFDPANVFSLRCSMPLAASDAAQRELHRWVDADTSTPVAFTSNMPFSGQSRSSPIQVRGVVGRDRLSAQISSVSQRYFAVMGIRLLRGRAFQRTDREDGPAVAVVNESFVRQYLSGRDPLTTQIRSLFGAREWRQIVGVVADARQASLDGPQVPHVYFPSVQAPVPWFTVVAKLPGANAQQSIRAIMSGIDGSVGQGTVMSLDEMVAHSIAQPRLYAFCGAFFMTSSLLLAAMGIYGLLSYIVRLRTREMGIRMVLGAAGSNIVSSYLLEVAIPTGVGLTSGFAVSAAVPLALSRFLYRQAAIDLTVAMWVVVILFATIVLAVAGPLRHGLKLDPAQILRQG